MCKQCAHNVHAVHTKSLQLHHVPGTPSPELHTLERLAVHEMFSQEVGVTNVQPREQCDGPHLRLRLERLNSSQDPLLHVIQQLVVFPVGIRQ
jgi:hypothetical protein